MRYDEPGSYPELQRVIDPFNRLIPLPLSGFPVH